MALASILKNILQETEQWLYNWVVDEYHFTDLCDARVPAPFLRWQNFSTGRTGAILPRLGPSCLPLLGWVFHILVKR